MKNKATLDQLIAFSKNITDIINSKDIVRTTSNNKDVELQNKESVS